MRNKRIETHANSCNLSLLRTQETRKEACVVKEYREKNAWTQEAFRPIHQKPRRKTPYCSDHSNELAVTLRQCGTLSRVRDRLKERRWRNVPLWGIPSEIRYRPARVRCPNCQAVKVEAIPWSSGKSPLTVGFIWLLAAWVKVLAWKVVAERFDVHWNSVQGAVRQAVDYGFKHRDLGSIFCIGIDELSRKKGHVYVTNVYDLEEKRLIWSGEGRSQETLNEFFEEHGEALKD